MNGPDSDLIERVERMEARQRAYKLHDPECDIFKETRMKEQRAVGWDSDGNITTSDPFLVPISIDGNPCSCWLSVKV